MAFGNTREGAWKQARSSLLPRRHGHEVEVFHFLPRPVRLAQELEARLDAGVQIEAADGDDAAHFLPAVMVHEFAQHHFERDAVQRVVRLCGVHSAGRFVVARLFFGKANTFLATMTMTNDEIGMGRVTPPRDLRLLFAVDLHTDRRRSKLKPTDG